jgi:hypothetical protein
MAQVVGPLVWQPDALERAWRLRPGLGDGFGLFRLE